MTTTTMTYTKVSYVTFAGKSDYGAATVPTSTAMTALIVHASAFVNTINDAAAVADHDAAVLAICVNYHKLANMYYRQGGASSASGEGGLTFNMSSLLPAEMHDMIRRSGRKNAPSDSIVVGSFRV